MMKFGSLIILLMIMKITHAANFKYYDTNNYFPENTESWFIVCPISNVYAEDFTVLFTSGAIKHITLSTCFIVPLERYNEFVKKPVIAIGSLYVHNVQNYAKTVNFDGQPLIIIMKDQSAIAITKSGLVEAGVHFHPIDDYWKKPMCSDFVHRVFLHITTKNEASLSRVQSEINTCTSKMIWDEIQRREDSKAVKQEILRKSMEFATKILETIPASNVIGTGADISLKMVDVMREMTVKVEGEVGSDKIIKSLCFSYQTAIDMILRYRQNENHN
jgi:hypothetical protein